MENQQNEANRTDSGAQRTPPYGRGYTPPPYNAQGYPPHSAYGQGYTPPPYTGQYPPYGQGYPPRPPYSPYGTPPLDPRIAEKRRHTKILRACSNAHGLSVLGFTALVPIVSLLLSLIPHFAQHYQTNDVFQIAMDCLLSVTVVFFPFFFCYLYQKRRGLQSEILFGTPNDGRAAVLLVFIALFFTTAGSYVSGFLLTIFENLFGVTFEFPENSPAITSVPVFLLTVVQTAVIPAFTEEFAIRGVVMQPLRKYGEKFALLMSAAVFALMHGNMVQIPFAFIAGIAIGYAVLATESVWVGVAIHFLNNFNSVLMQVAIDNLPNVQENMAILGILACVFLAGVICLVVYIRQYERRPLRAGDTTLQSGEKTKAYLCTAPMILAGVLLLVQTAKYIHF